MTITKSIKPSKLNNESDGYLREFQRLGRAMAGNLDFRRDLFETEGFKTHIGLYPAFTRELVAKPRDGERIGRGDLVDKETRWVVPASEIMKAKGDPYAPGTFLFVEPGIIQKEGGKIVIFSDRIIAVADCVSNCYGKVHPETGLIIRDAGVEISDVLYSEPTHYVLNSKGSRVKLSRKEESALSYGEAGCFRISAEALVRPIVHSHVNRISGGKIEYTTDGSMWGDLDPSMPFGVAERVLV